MKVIVCGAGQVGYNIARHLALENNDVTVVDQSPELVRRINDNLDVNGIVGQASHPAVLDQAGARDSDMLIAVTATDEVNMVACQVAHSIFEVPTKIARIREQGYLSPLWANLFFRDNIPIDVIISPEIEVARAVTRRLQVPGAFEMIPLVEDKVKLIGVRCDDDCPLVNTPLRQLTQLFPDLSIVIIGLMRDGQPIVPTSEDQMLPGDEVYFVVDSEQVGRAMAAFGHEETEARRLLIFGGGNIGFFLAQEIEREHHWVRTKIIESDRERAESIAGKLEKTMVIQGNVLDSEILEEAGVATTETVVAVTNDDETNILASLLAKRYGCQRAITLINKGTYENLINSLEIDVTVSPRNITVSTILQHIRRGRIHSVHTLREGFGELIEAEALETSELVGRPLKEVNLPSGVLLGAIVRDGQMICPGGSTVVEPHDRIVLFAAAEVIRKVEKMFSVQLEYF
ncbi:MAG: Trk system potassium transporter TrkA [Rhodospirillaceae bacterium]|nr:Trk system potassium transporter TrkA [Rhodospirillaceae bacterium]